MRGCECKTMIGSLLYYVLYPLSRSVTGRHSEASKKGLSLAVVNGKAVWDGGASTRRFTQSQETLPHQGLGPSSGPKGKTKERMKEPSPEKEADARPDTDKQLVAVLHEETQEEAGSTVGGAKSTAREEEAEVRTGQQQDKVDAPEQEVGEASPHCEVFHIKQNTEDGSIFPAEDFSPELALGTQVEYPQTENSAQETTSRVQEKIKMPSLEESVTPAESRIQETACPSHEQISSLEESLPLAEPSIKTTTHPVQETTQIPSMEESVTPAKTPAEETECWDEYVAQTADEMRDSNLNGLLSKTQTHLKHSEQHGAQASWHFPAGLGLAEEVECPLLKFPALSCYPQQELTVPFEVMWRLWEDVDESATVAELFPFTKPSMDFTVMSYNILAEDLLEANQELYTHCPLEVLDWSYRCSLLLEEIQKWEPDILCLQEVQENHYYEQLHPVLSQMGYTCVYKRRTATKTDGCATCYRGTRFLEISVTKVEFFRPEMDLLDRHNVGIVLLLRPVVIQGSEVKARGLPLCVANTHLLFNPKRGDVKLAQLAIMLAEIDGVVKSCKAKGEQCNLIMCGDFNSVPHMPLYQLITTGELYFQGLPAWMVSGQQDLSYKVFCQRLFAPLWPSSLGITDSCQYTTGDTEALKSQSQRSGRCQYSHDFMRQLRFCPAACVRPMGLEMIPRVTDNTPDASKESHLYDKSFRHTISHRFDLESVYKHILPGFGNPEVTTLHSEGGATVDYIFYTPRRILTGDQNADFVSQGLKLVGSLSLLSEDVLWSLTGLPNHIFPSDHLSLLAKFQLDLNAA